MGLGGAFAFQWRPCAIAPLGILSPGSFRPVPVTASVGRRRPVRYGSSRFVAAVVRFSMAANKQCVSSCCPVLNDLTHRSFHALLQRTPPCASGTMPTDIMQVVVAVVRAVPGNVSTNGILHVSLSQPAVVLSGRFIRTQAIRADASFVWTVKAL